MKTYVISLESHDDVLSARDKISWSKANRVLLVWPRRGRVLERRVDLLILQRYAQSLGAQIAVVAGGSLVRGNARDLGIPVFATAERAHEVPWRRARRRRRLRLRRSAQDPSQAELSFRQRLAELRKKTELKPTTQLAVFFAGLGAFFALVLLFLPGAEVRLVPEQVTQQFDIPVWASPEIQVANPSGGLPAQVLSVLVEGRDFATSTGQARIPDRTAAGQVTFTNLTDRSLTVPAGSAVITLDNRPARYITIRDARVQSGPGKTVNVLVQAETAGAPGNLAARKIAALEGPLGLSLSVENAAPIRGGRDRLGASPSQEDYSSLREKLLVDLQATAADEIANQVGGGQMLLPGTLQIATVIEETRLPEVSQPGDQLQLVLRVEYQALAVQEADLQAVARSALDANLKDGYEPIPDSLQFKLSGSTGPASDRPEDARWQLHIERALSPVWSGTDLTQAVRGHSLSAASEILQSRLPLAEPPQIDTFPLWWPRLPFLAFRISLVKP